MPVAKIRKDFGEVTSERAFTGSIMNGLHSSARRRQTTQKLASNHPKIAGVLMIKNTLTQYYL